MSFEKNISQLLNIDSLQACSSLPMEPHPLPERTGEGSCRIFRFGSGAAMILLNCKSLQNYSCCVHDESLLHISYYEEVHGTHHSPCTVRPLLSDMFYSHVGISGRFQTVYEAHTPVKAVHIFLAPEYYDSYLSQKIPDSGTCLKEAVAMLDQVEYFPELAVIFQQLYSYRGTGAPSLLFYESKLTEILALILQKSSDGMGTLPRHVKHADIEAAHQIAEYISSHATQEISLDALAHMAYMSPAKLKYVFKAVFHCSIRDYRLQKRMHIAKEFLYHTDLPIADVAIQLGYRTSGNFAAIFKKYTGFSPKDYRVFSRTSSKCKF